MHEVMSECAGLQWGGGGGIVCGMESRGNTGWGYGDRDDEGR